MSNTPRQSQPQALSHYTTLEGLKGIVDSKSLWASNAAFLNDKSELTHALNVAESVVKELSSKSAFRDWKPFLEAAIKEIEAGKIPASYVCCFCDDDDNLSQWRGYGGFVQGISISFDRKQLSGRLRQGDARLMKVVYTKVSTAKKFASAVRDQLEAVGRLDEVSGRLSHDRLRRDIFRRVSSLIPSFKHLGFKDEREWRFVVQRDVSADEMSFRVISNKIVPYIDIGKSEEKLPIVSVRIGPGADQELTGRSVENFLRAKGYDVPVKVSEVPFRQ